MNIDLLLTGNGDAGLVCDELAQGPVAGVMFDSETGFMSLEYTEIDALDLNIPIDDSYIETLYYATSIQIGTIIDGEIRDSRQVPILILNDPQANSDRARFAKPRSSVVAFERFLKACVTGQPIHRADLSDETSTGSVMGGMNTAILKFAPNLARQRTMEIAPTHAPKGPNAPGLNMGGGGGYRGGGQAKPIVRQPPTHRDSDDDKDKR